MTGKLKSFDAFQAGKATVNSWKRLGHTSLLLETAASEVDFTNASLTIEGTFRFLHALQLQLASFVGVVSPANLLVIHVECFKLLERASGVLLRVAPLQFACWWCERARMVAEP